MHPGVEHWRQLGRQDSLDFGTVEGRAVLGRGGVNGSDAGTLPVGAIDKAVRLVGRFDGSDGSLERLIARHRKKFLSHCVHGNTEMLRLRGSILARNTLTFFFDLFTSRPRGGAPELWP
jgi:hypothetical protein